MLWSVEMRSSCEKKLRGTANRYGMNIINLEVDVDHVHINIEIPPQRSVGEAVRILKSVSARRMFKEWPVLKRKLWGGNLWEGSYFARGVGDGVTADMVKRYIENHSEKAQNSKQLKLFPKGKA